MKKGTSAQDHPLLLLALRCEREEPSRKLDCHIALLLCDDERSREWYRGFLSIPSDQEIFYPYNKSIALYTTSLDAAVTLVPEKYGWSIYWDRATEGQCMARVWCRAYQPVNGSWTNYAPLALCAAALRARAAIAKTEAK